MPAVRTGFANAVEVLANPILSIWWRAAPRVFLCVRAGRSGCVCGVATCAQPTRAALEGGSAALAAGTAYVNAVEVFALV